MKDQTAETITTILVEIFSRLGVPDFLHSDQGRNFEAKLLQDTCKSLGIRKTHTTAYHPEGNSLVERSNRSILQMLRCYVEKSHEWETYLPLVLFAYRTTKHSSTGVTPFEIMFGRNPTEMTEWCKPPEEDITSYQLHLNRKLAEIREFVEGQLIDAQKNQKKYYDRHADYELMNSRFAVGENVWLVNSSVRGVVNKLTDRWEGGWKVVEVKSIVTVVIRHMDGRIRVVHVNRLQPHITRDQEYSTNQLQNCNRENHNSGGFHNRSENQLLDQSHCFRDRTEESRSPEEDVSRSFRQGGDDRELQSNKLEESVTIPANFDFEDLRTSTPIADRMNVTLQNLVHCNDSHELSPTTKTDELVLRRSKRIRRIPKYLEEYEQY